MFQFALFLMKNLLSSLTLLTCTHCVFLLWPRLFITSFEQFDYDGLWCHFLHAAFAWGFPEILRSVSLELSSHLGNLELLIPPRSLLFPPHPITCIPFGFVPKQTDVHFFPQSFRWFCFILNSCYWYIFKFMIFFFFDV